MGLTSAEVNRKRHTLLLYCFSITAGLASAQTAFQATPLQYSFAPAGIAAGITMRLNVANLGSGTSVCSVNLSFVNSDGSSIKNEDILVKAGQTMSYTLQTGDIAGTPTSAEVRGVVKIQRSTLTPGTPVTPPCSAAMSLELVTNATQQTQAVMTNPTLVTGLVGVFSSVPPMVPPFAQ